MEYIVNSREMKQYDSNTTEYFGIPSMVLMERAALAFVEELKKRREDCSKVLVVCGTGNNGGDGIAVARLLALSGSCVDVVFPGDKKSATEQNKLQQKIYRAYGYQLLSEIPEKSQYTIVIDAVFGVGLSRNVEGNYADVIRQMNALTGRKIAVDIASGISADNGNVLGVAFRADYTVTFAYAKIGMLLWPGNEYSGTVVVKDIGIGEQSFLEREPGVAAFTDSDLALLPPRKNHSNKGTYGKLLIIAGSVNMAGAAYLSAKAAYSAGCGLVRIVTPEENRQVIQTSLPEAILTTYSSKRPEMSVITEAVNWADVIVCGPGLGMTEAAEALVKCVLKNASVPVLMDADALNIIAKDASILLRPHTEMVLTPHLGEMGRLTGDSIAYIQNRLIEVAEEFARQYNIICVLKDEHTVVSVPYSRTYLNLSGNSGMATAGSGDVLSGIIGSLMAQGLGADKAAPLGVYLHGKAGDIMIAETGKRGLMASDLIAGVRRCLAAWEDSQKGFE